MAIIALLDGPRRFTELRDALSPITAKVLTQTLRAMERDGLIVRRDFDENPPHVEYVLSDLGRSLIEVIDAMRAWSDRNLAELLANRAAGDAMRRDGGDLPPAPASTDGRRRPAASR